MKANFKLYLLGFIMMAVTSSCEKDIIELPESNDPVFRAHGTFNGDAFEIVAGDNNAYMHTSTSQVNGVSVHSGKLSDGNFSIEMGIYEGDVDQPGSDILEVIDQCSEWSFSSTQELVILSKELFPNASLISNVEWTVNGNLQSGMEVPIYEPGVYEVCAFVAFTNQTYGQLCNEIIIGYERNSNFRLHHYINQDGILSTWMGDIDGDVSTSKWYLDGNLVGKNVDLAIEVDSSSHYLRADVVFADGTVRSKSILLDGSLNGNYIDDFTVFEQEDLSTVVRDYKWRVIVEENGVTYSSENIGSSNSSMLVHSIEPYADNANGKQVYKVSCTVSTNVMPNSGGTEIPLTFDTHFGIEIDD